MASKFYFLKLNCKDKEFLVGEFLNLNTLVKDLKKLIKTKDVVVIHVDERTYDEEGRSVILKHYTINIDEDGELTESTDSIIKFFK